MPPSVYPSVHLLHAPGLMCREKRGKSPFKLPESFANAKGRMYATYSQRGNGIEKNIYFSLSVSASLNKNQILSTSSIPNSQDSATSNISATDQVRFVKCQLISVQHIYNYT